MFAAELVGKFTKLFFRYECPHQPETLIHRFRAWVKDHENEMERAFDYVPSPGKPSIRSLVRPDFHPDGFVMWNYTPVAHMTLHLFEDGWSDPIRLARGLVFDTQGELLALPFPKFFNYGEHRETREFKRARIVDAREKFDGHLGIIIPFAQRFYLTTRGRFTSPSALLGTDLVQRHAKKHHWNTAYPHHLTVLVEIVHPNTRVHVDYGGASKLVLIGAFHRQTGEDIYGDALDELGELLSLEVSPRVNVRTIKGLTTLMRDRSVENREGIVARFDDGRRVKFKFERYIGLMVAAKLNHSYLMRRIMDNKARTMIATLDEEVRPAALRMKRQLLRVRPLAHQNPRAAVKRIRSFVVPERDIASFQQTAREFVRFLRAE
ncbi:MAG: RNA ligase [Patescibacteria group bacterium]|jgi:RNA ligase